MDFFNKLFSSGKTPKTESEKDEKKTLKKSIDPKLHSDNILKPSDIYFPDEATLEPAVVKEVELSEKEAVALGWSYRKKSKSIRLTNYHGTESSLIVPSKIGGIKVNELGNYVFRNSKAESVEMPNTIVKIGAEIFRYSEVKRVILSDRIRYLPDRTFNTCKNLEEVHLPTLLSYIGKQAFLYCQNLKYVHLPTYLYAVDEEAFYRSGLEGFSADISKLNRSYGLNDGSAFVGTPLQKNYKLLAVPMKNSESIRVLLVSENANIKFPRETRIIMEKNSVCGSCSIDFSECECIIFENEVYRDHRVRYGSKINQYLCTAVVSKDTDDLYFPYFVKVVCPDKTPYKGTLEITENNGNKDSITIKVLNDNLHPFSVNTGAKEISLISSGKRDSYFRAIQKYAFFEKNLISVNLGIFTWINNDEIFSPYCREIHNVSWYDAVSARSAIHKHIPPSSLLGNGFGEIIHTRLMKAFAFNLVKSARHPLYRTRDGSFFDQGVIDKIFSDGYVDNTYSIRKIELNQKNKILIAIDVLRSSRYARWDGVEEREMYKEYLRTHRRYAEIVCNKIYDDYPEYADYLMSLEE